MKVCKTCGALCLDESKFCEKCGQSFDTKSHELPLWAKIFIPLLAIAVVSLSVILVTERNKTVEEAAPTTTISVSEIVTSVTEPEITNSTTTAQTTQQQPANQLYLPDSSLFVNQYSAYVYCTDTSVQDYVKMRFGPSKEKYEVVGTLPNYAEVTVETKSVDGWTLIFDGLTEGWVRSDFIFTR